MPLRSVKINAINIQFGHPLIDAGRKDQYIIVGACLERRV